VTVRDAVEFARQMREFFSAVETYGELVDALDVEKFGSLSDRVVASIRRPCGRTLYVLIVGPEIRPHRLPLVRVWDVSEPREARIDSGTLRHYWDHLAVGDVAQKFDEHQARWTP